MIACPQCPSDGSGRTAGTGDPSALVGLWAAALTGMLLSAVSWSAERNWKLSGGAVAIGGAALAWLFVWVALLSLLAVVVLWVVIGGLARVRTSSDHESVDRLQNKSAWLDIDTTAL